MTDNDKIIQEVTSDKYKYGFTTEIEQEMAVKGLTEDTVRFISAKKNEPEFMLNFRLKAFRLWQTMKEPKWAHLKYKSIDFQSISYYAAQKKKEAKDISEVDPKLLDTFNKLGIPLEEQLILAGVAVDVVMDSSSVITTYKDKLKELELFSVPLGRHSISTLN